MDYDYARYEELLQHHLNAIYHDSDEGSDIGEDVSSIPEVKIIFDGYGDLEDEDENGEYRYTEGGNKNMESFAIFIHKDALVEDFIFPPHDVFGFTFGSMIQHRPAEEVCIYAWHDVENNSWDILPLEDRLDDSNEMDETDVMKILEGLYELYFKPWEGKFTTDPITGLPNWPFQK
jgi:hypothetical protein